VDPLLNSDRNTKPSSVITAQSVDLMMTMVAAGYGVCLAPISEVQRYRAFGIAWRQIEDPPMTLTTYLLHRKDAGNNILKGLVDALLSTS
jgi:DNA-binding transcriptional LysR family regulator